MKEITIWERFDKDDNWSFNHISDGYDINVSIPIAVNNVQKKSWKSSKWRSIKAYLNDENVVVYD